MFLSFSPVLQYEGPAHSQRKPPAPPTASNFSSAQYMYPLHFPDCKERVAEQLYALALRYNSKTETPRHTVMMGDFQMVSRSSGTVAGICARSSFF